jgi:MoaA/NifB/PqqE/SkfB family radical SAM enzyme
MGVYCRPSSIMFLLTERCNARCVHCDIWKNRGKEDSPGLDGWSRVLRELRSWLGPKPIVFTGGEALLRPFTLDLVNEAKGLGFPLEVLTNGYWRDQTKIEKLAKANPWRITMSLDGVGDTHSIIRGREDFFERSNQTLETLLRVREQDKHTYTVRLKTVIMRQNLDQVGAIAKFATRPGVEVLYQPVEQNYAAHGDPLWFESSANWPQDTEKAVAAVEELIRLKREGLHIANSESGLAQMLPYFREPAKLAVLTQTHLARNRKPLCAALNSLQFQSNGDVTVCSNRSPVGNIREQSVRQIWAHRPQYWKSGCCLND